MGFQVEKSDLVEIRKKYLNYLENKKNNNVECIETAQLVGTLVDTIQTLSDTMETWALKAEKVGLAVPQDIPAPITNYIEDVLMKRYSADDPQLAKHIIKEFEAGDLKGIISKDGKVDEKKLNKWLEIRRVALDKEKYRLARGYENAKIESEEDVF